MKKRFHLNIFFILLFCITVKAQEQSFTDYAALLKDRCKIFVTFPDNIIEYNPAATPQYFSFDEFQSSPKFYYDPIINLTANCNVVLMDVINQKQAHYDIGQLVVNYYPDAVSWMLKNCDLPWDRWSYTPPGGLFSEADMQKTENKLLKTPIEQERAEMIKKANSLRLKYEQTIEHNELTEKTNCSVIYVVKIPNMERVICTDESLSKRLKKNSTDCYGVEFHNSSTHIGLKMLLFFDDKEGKTIGDYLEQLSQYIRFE